VSERVCTSGTLEIGGWNDVESLGGIFCERRWKVGRDGGIDLSSDGRGKFLGFGANVVGGTVMFSSLYSSFSYRPTNRPPHKVKI
jgi:hypothetical protein